MSCHFIVMNMEKEWNKNDLGMLFEKRDIFIYYQWSSSRRFIDWNIGKSEIRILHISFQTYVKFVDIGLL